MEERETAQRTELEEAADSFLYGKYIRQLAFHMIHLQDEMLAPYDITSQQARALGVIRTLNNKKGFCCQKDLESSFGLRGSSITSLLKGLERRGYVSRVSGQEDARTKLLSLTAKGEALIDTFLTIFLRTERRIVNNMSEGERETLLELLRRAAENLNH